MRKLFATTFAITAMLSLVVGIAFAWTSSASSSNSIGYGSLQVGVDAAQTSNQLYPTGAPIRVLTGSIINNTPTNPGIAVRVDGANPGTFQHTGVSGEGCSGAIAGQVVQTDGNFVQPGGNAGGGFAIDVTIATDASNECQGETLNYNYTVNVTTD